MSSLPSFIIDEIYRIIHIDVSSIKYETDDFIKTLKYLDSLNPQYDEDILQNMIILGRVFKICINKITACKYGLINLLKFFYIKNPCWCGIECDTAALNGNYRCLVYCDKNGCPINSIDKCFISAVYSKNIKCAKYLFPLLENRDDGIYCKIAFINNDYYMFKYLFNQNLRVLKSDINIVIRHSNLKILKLMRKKGVVFTQSHLDFAKSLNKTECFDILENN